MKDKWYGDNRDLVKWGVLLKLADDYKANRILQIAYYRPEIININGESHFMPNVVTNHFGRNLMGIMGLSTSRIEIDVFDEPVVSFDEYTKKVLERIKKLPNRSNPPCIIFLDPDNELQPTKSKPKLEHVRECDLHKIWKAIRSNDICVFYQHKTDPLKHKNDSEWIEQKRKQFKSALSSFRGTVKIVKCGVATDVVFFYSQKLESELSKEESNNEKCGKVCPECDHQFTGNTYGGIDAHWRAEHEAIMPYKEAWQLIKSEKYQRRSVP